MGFIARSDTDDGFLMVGVGTGDGFIQAHHGGAARLRAVFAIAKTDDGVRRAIQIFFYCAGDIVFNQPQYTGIASGSFAGAFGVTVKHQGMVMVGSNDDQGIGESRIADLGFCYGSLDGVVKSERILQRFFCRGFMQGVIDTAAFYHQEITLGIFTQDIHRLGRHLGQARFFSCIAI